MADRVDAREGSTRSAFPGVDERWVRIEREQGCGWKKEGYWVLRFRDPGRVCFKVQVVVIVFTFPLLRRRISKRMNRARGNLVSGRPQDGMYQARRKSRDRS